MTYKDDSLGIGRESARDAGAEAYIYAAECSRWIQLFSDLEQRIAKVQEKNAKEEHTVNRYEQEEQERERPTIASYRPIRKAEAADCISPIEGRELDQ